MGPVAGVNAAEAVGALLGRPVAEASPLGGVYRVRLADGGEVVAKRHAQASAVHAETAGLRWLRAASGPPNSSVVARTDISGPRTPAADHPIEPNPSESPTGAPGGPPISTLPAGADSSGPREPGTGAVVDTNPSERSIHAPGGPPDSTLPAGTDGFGRAPLGCPQVPAVLGADDEWLVIEMVPAGRASVAAAERFGRELAELHQAGAAAFGSAPPGGPVDAWIGLVPMRNVAGRHWPEWYAEHRVLPYLRAAVDRQALPDPAAIEAVCARISELAGPAEPPARLHGDLWNGNVLWSGDRVWLVDPAAHGGHRETDLGMLRLFGCPHLERIVAAYDEVWPLAAGWRERIGLHQLFPLLVHAVLFGGGYGAQAVAAARSLA